MNMKLAIVFGMLSLGAMSCNTPAPPTLAKCTTPEMQPATSVTTNAAVVFKAQAKTLDSASIDGYDANRVLAQDKGIVGGDFIVSDCSQGLLRQVTSISTANVGVDARGIEKVYLNTSDASLEDVVTSGDLGLDYGALDFNQATVLSALPGVQTRAVNGALPFKDTVIPIGNGATLKVSGSITQTLNPKFNLKFSNGSMEKLEIGLSGGFGVSMTGKLTATAKIAALTADFEKELVSYRFTRAFLVGVVPVVVVIEPKLIVGAAASANEPLTVTAGISPNVNLNFSIKYDRAATNKWTIVEPTASFSANPTFDISTPSGAKTKAYAKLALSMKFYGVVGPEIETKPFSVVTIVPGQTTKINTGITLSGTVNAGFKVLGKNLSLSTSSVSSNALTANYNCTSASCIIAAANPLPESMR
jgi:hypothetical protein